MAAAAEPDIERCMQEALEGGPGSGSGATAGAGAFPGEMAGLHMEETVLMEVEVLLSATGPAWLVEEEEEEDEPVLETAGGVNWPLLSEPVLSRAGEDFFFGGLALALLPLCCCWRHLALRFLNHTYSPEHRAAVSNHTHWQAQQVSPTSVRVHYGGKLGVMSHQGSFPARPLGSDQPGV